MAPTPEVTRYVGNQSSRNAGAVPRIIVLHTTESHDRGGYSDLQGIGSWFDNPASQASSHVSNDQEGFDARWVADERKAWTQAAFNSQALSIEQIAFSAYDRNTWLKERSKQLANTAQWLAYWSKKYNIPLTHSTSHGVCQHKDLGAAGGGHHDCGDGYPFDFVLGLAKNTNVDPEVLKQNKWRIRLQALRSKAARRKAAGRTAWAKSMHDAADKLKRAIRRSRAKEKK